MTRSIRFLALAACLALAAAAAPLPGASASHNGNLNVQVGQFFGVGGRCNQATFEGCRAAESMRFLAPSLRVHEGDVVTFDIQGFHTATFLPRPTDLFDWAARNAGGVGKPWSLWGPEADDTAIDPGGSTSTPSIKVNNKAFFPSHSGCGESASNPCGYDGSAYVNSGVPSPAAPPAFSVRIDAAPDANNPIWVVCLVHPHMFIRIIVVPDDAATTTQTEIDADEAAKIALDQEWAQATDAEMLKSKSSHVNSSGQRVSDVYAGVDNHWATLYGFYPKKIAVRKGQTVRFHFTEGIYEVHTATFPIEDGFELFDETFVPLCDPDGDSGAGPDTPADEEGPPCGGDLSKVELDAPPMMFYPQGDGTFGGTDYENSGLRGAVGFAAAPRNDPWDLKFTKASAKGYRYLCVIHGAMMSGRVIVK